MRTGGTMNSVAPMASETAMSQHSPWHSPVPYLFGGLAAMLGLIAFALLILACSYWKLSGYLENGDEAERDPENGDEKGSDGIKVPAVYEERIVVIMAGDKKPTFIATPRCSSFADKNKKNSSDENEKSEKNKGPEVEMGHREQQQQQQQQAEQNRETTQSQNQETQNQNQ